MFGRHSPHHGDAPVNAFGAAGGPELALRGVSLSLEGLPAPGPAVATAASLWWFQKCRRRGPPAG